jgi:hypothetical protein
MTPVASLSSPIPASQVDGMPYFIISVCRIGSGQVVIIFPDPERHPEPADPGTDPYLFQPV